MDIIARLSTNFFFWNTNWRAGAEESGLNADTHDDGIARVEDELGQDAELAGEDGGRPELVLLLLLVLVAVFHEGVEQVVDDVCSEDADAHVVGHVLRVSLYFDVEGENAGVLHVTLEHHRRTHDVTTMHRSDVNASKLKHNTHLNSTCSLKPHEKC